MARCSLKARGIGSAAASRLTMTLPEIGPSAASECGVGSSVSGVRRVTSSVAIKAVVLTTPPPSRTSLTSAVNSSGPIGAVEQEVDLLSDGSQDVGLGVVDDLVGTRRANYVRTPRAGCRDDVGCLG